MQLKGERSGISTGAATGFQFQLGAIKRKKKPAGFHTKAEFQFQLGAIKSRGLDNHITIWPKFQFQLGAIKRCTAGQVHKGRT